jgi:hypothetical protein
MPTGSECPKMHEKRIASFHAFFEKYHYIMVLMTSFKVNELQREFQRFYEFFRAGTPDYFTITAIFAKSPPSRDMQGQTGPAGSLSIFSRMEYVMGICEEVRCVLIKEWPLICSFPLTSVTGMSCVYVRAPSSGSGGAVDKTDSPCTGS